MPSGLCPLRSFLVALRSALCALHLFIFVLPWSPASVSAQGILQGVSGSLDFNYSFSSSKTKDSSGNTIKTETENYNPRFTLNIDTKIYPNLRFHGGGVVEANVSDFKTDETETKTTITRLRPYLDLTFETPLYTAGVGYNRREEKTKTSEAPSVNLIRDEYSTILGWRPDGLPSLDMRMRRTNNFDEDRSLRDITEDFFSLISKYSYTGLQLHYNGTFTHTQDDLNGLDVRQQTHSGRVNYSNSFFDKRVSLSTTYDILYGVVETESEGKGTVSQQIFPFAGLSAIDDTPADGALLPNPSLIDGNLIASSGINIGLPPLGGDARPRNIGLDFLNATEVNNLLVWVDQELPSTIANSFSWQLWVSSDNLNWSLLTTISPAPFGPLQNRFDLSFPRVSTRYIKVVTSPLSPAVPGASGFPNIFVAEIQAFINRPAEDVEERTRNSSQTYNLDVRTRLFNYPSLFYELYYFFNRSEPSSQRRYNLSNGFSIHHRFSQIFSGSGRVAREDGEETDEKRVAYVYNASILADPIPTLRHSLVFNGRDEEIGGRPNDNYSIHLYNNAQLYQGIDLNLSGGLNIARQETGERRRDIVINVGTNIVPHRTVTFGLNYSDTLSRRKGGGREESSTETRRLALNVNFNPFRTFYFFALYQVIDEEGKDIETIQNYGINWSPFPDGALQFNFAYNETLRSEDNVKERILTPSVRWNITKRSYLDFSYQMVRSKTDFQETDSKVFSMNLKIFF